jgi:prophage tail gpP-like protein
MTEGALQVNNKVYGGWTGIEVQRSVDHLAGSFTFTAVGLWSGKSTLRTIPPGAACIAKMGDTPVITGYVDAIDVAYSAKQHQVTVTGRDAAGDLVDCSAVHGSGDWYGQPMDKIVADLISVHGIKLTVATDVGRPFTNWRISPAETVWESIERMARQRGVLVMSDGLGGIVITQPSTRRLKTALTLGKNIKLAQGTNDVSRRFHVYVAMGQSELLDQASYSTAVTGSGQSTDAAIRANRVLIVAAEEAFDTSTYETRAKWEAATHYGRGLNLSVTVTGWSHAEELWEPDCMVRLDDDFMSIHDWLYISSVTYRLNDEGTTTVLGLTRREAFQTLAIPEKGDLGA